MSQASHILNQSNFSQPPRPWQRSGQPSKLSPPPPIFHPSPPPLVHEIPSITLYSVFLPSKLTVPFSSLPTSRLLLPAVCVASGAAQSGREGAETVEVTFPVV